MSGTLLLLLGAGCRDTMMNAHCDTEPVEISDDEDPGLGTTPAEVLSSAVVGRMTVTLSGDATGGDSIPGLPANGTSSSEGAFGLVRGSGTAWFTPASDGTCDDSTAEISLPVEVSIETSDNSMHLAREGWLSWGATANGRADLWTPIESSDFGGDWAEWILASEAAAVDGGCEILDPWIDGTNLSDPSLTYAVSAECPDEMTTVSAIKIAWVPLDAP